MRHGPWPLRMTVDEGERPADLKVAQRSPPSTFGLRLGVAGGQSRRAGWRPEDGHENLL